MSWLTSILHVANCEGSGNSAEELDGEEKEEDDEDEEENDFPSSCLLDMIIMIQRWN